MAAIAVALVVVAVVAAIAGEPVIATVVAIVAVAQIVAFVTTASGRSVSTIVFTDIARSTELVSEIGDRAWQQLFEHHAAVVRRELLGAHAGFVKDLGDGFLAAVPIAAGTPGHVVEATLRIIEDAAGNGLEVRAGIHVGECGLQRADVRGLAVHVAARVMGAAEPGQLVVTDAVRVQIDEQAVMLRDLGDHQLVGVRHPVHLYAVGAEPS